MTLPSLNCFMTYTWNCNVLNGRFPTMPGVYLPYQNRDNFSFKLIESLSTTGTYEDVILRGFPKEAPPYKSLYVPFDDMIWKLTFCSVIFVALTLFVIEKTWHIIKPKDVYKTDGVYQTLNTKTCHIKINNFSSFYNFGHTGKNFAI